MVGVLRAVADFNACIEALDRRAPIHAQERRKQPRARGTLSFRLVQVLQIEVQIVEIVRGVKALIGRDLVVVGQVVVVIDGNDVDFDRHLRSPSLHDGSWPRAFDLNERRALPRAHRADRLPAEQVDRNGVNLLTIAGAGAMLRHPSPPGRRRDTGNLSPSDHPHRRSARDSSANQHRQKIGRAAQTRR